MIRHPIIIGGGTKLPTLTTPGAAADLLAGKQLVDQYGNVLTGAMPEVAVPTPVLTNSDGLITASVTQDEGHTPGGSKSATLQLPVKTDADLTASGAAVTVPAGYYAADASKSVATATKAAPTITVSSAGLITAKYTQAAGYVTAGTKSATKQLTTKAAATITPGTADQTIAAGTYLTGLQTISGDANLLAENIKSGTSIFGVAGTYAPAVTQATPSISVSSAGLITAKATQTAGYVAAGTKSATKQMTVKAAATITPGTANQTIAAGTYLTGAQTIKGDANLLAENIKSGVSIFGVAGELISGGNYYTTSLTIPSSGTSLSFDPGFDTNVCVILWQGFSAQSFPTSSSATYDVAHWWTKSENRSYHIYVSKTEMYMMYGNSKLTWDGTAITWSWSTSMAPIKDNGTYVVFAF